MSCDIVVTRSGPLYTSIVGVSKPRFVDEVGEWWRYLGARQLAGYISAMAGIGLTIWAVNVEEERQVLTAVFAAVAQGFAAFFFSGHGKADGAHARRAIGRLLGLADRVRSAEASATGSFERNISASDRRDRMGALSVELSWIGEEVRSSVLDWIVFNEHLAELVSDDDRPKALADAREAADNPQPVLPSAQSDRDQSDEQSPVTATAEEEGR